MFNTFNKRASDGSSSQLILTVVDIQKNDAVNEAELCD